MKRLVWFAGTVLLMAAGAGRVSGQVALLDSANTKEFFSRHYPNCSPPASFYLGAEEYQRYFRGWEYVLNQAPPISYTIIHDNDVTAAGLAKYKLLILSNNASLSDEQAQAIQYWVIGGGRLLATFGSGYKGVTLDPRQDDLLKLQKGGTFGLHELWHDPATKVFSSLAIDPAHNGSVDVRISRYEGPTACLSGQLVNDVLPYGALGNILAQRPENHPGVLGFLIIQNPDWKRPEPAIITTRAAAGLVVYYAFAPEYIVSKEFGLPASPSCPDGQNWTGRSTQGRILMRCTIDYLLGN